MIERASERFMGTTRNIITRDQRFPTMLSWAFFEKHLRPGAGQSR